MNIRDTIHIIAKIFSYLDTHPELIDEIFIKEKPDDSVKDTSSKSKKKVEAPDVYKIYEHNGIEGLKKKLEECDIETLKEIVKSYRLDPKRYFYRWTTKKKFIEFITGKIESKIEKGKSFITTDEDGNAQQ